MLNLFSKKMKHFNFELKYFTSDLNNFNSKLKLFRSGLKTDSAEARSRSTAARSLVNLPRRFAVGLRLTRRMGDGRYFGHKRRVFGLVNRK